jgi:uncharacterized protein (TIGR02145 family)
MKIGILGSGLMGSKLGAIFAWRAGSLDSVRYRKIPITTCLMLLAQNLFSQIVLQGTVTDNGGEYLGNGAETAVNALVTVTDQADAGRTFSAQTDDQGNYAIQITQTGVVMDPSVNPCDLSLLQNYPNPFNPSTVIVYQLTHPSHIHIEIYNVLGRKIKTLFDGFQNSSGHVVWNATDDNNRGVPAGLYIYSIHAGNVSINKKMVLIDGQQDQIKAKPSQATGSVTEVQHQTVLRNTISDQYTLQVTGVDIAPYEQQNLEITGNLTVDITVSRTVTDMDGNVYPTVKIGDQWWMAENLNAKYYRNGEGIPNVTSYSEWSNLSTGAYCNYDSNAVNASTYGCLYNWYAVKDSRNIAPLGWHVPTDEEWTTLATYLGGVSIAGGKLKETGTAHWIEPNTGATNESGFCALPGGYRFNLGDFFDLGYKAFFWSSTDRGSTLDLVWYRSLFYDSPGAVQNDTNKSYGFSIRLVRDY